MAKNWWEPGYDWKENLRETTKGTNLEEYVNNLWGSTQEPVSTATPTVVDPVVDPNEQYGVWGNNKWLGLDEIQGMGFGLDTTTGKYRGGGTGETLNEQGAWWTKPETPHGVAPSYISHRFGVSSGYESPDGSNDWEFYNGKWISKMTGKEYSQTTDKGAYGYTGGTDTGNEPPTAPITPYGEPVKYVSPYTKDYWNEARSVTQANLIGATRPAMEEALAGSREQNIRRGGVSSGLIQAGEQPIIKAYNENIANQMGQFEQKRLATDISEAGKGADFNMNEQLAQRQWDRTQSASALGQNYMAKLNQWDQDNQFNYWTQKNAITEKYNNKVLDKQAAATELQNAFTKSMQEYQNQWAEIQADKARADANQDWERSAALTREGWRYQQDMQTLQQNFEIDQQGWNLFGQVLGTGVGAFAAFSDRRLKQNIKRIGTHLLGIGIYEFNYLWDKVLHIGVMADEVREVVPEAVIKHSSGFDMVDYGMLSEVK